MGKLWKITIFTGKTLWKTHYFDWAIFHSKLQEITKGSVDFERFWACNRSSEVWANRKPLKLGAVELGKSSTGWWLGHLSEKNESQLG